MILALLHPGGSIGRRLLLRVEDLMHTQDAIPRVYEDMLMKHVIMEVTSKRLGVTGVFSRDEELVGVVTDGDLRRALEKYENMLEKRAQDVMVREPKGIEKGALAAVALRQMEEFSITSLFVFRGGRRGSTRSGYSISTTFSRPRSYRAAGQRHGGNTPSAAPCSPRALRRLRPSKAIWNWVPRPCTPTVNMAYSASKSHRFRTSTRRLVVRVPRVHPIRHRVQP